MRGNLLVGNIGTHGGPIKVQDGSADVGVASGAVEREAHPEGDERGPGDPLDRPSDRSAAKEPSDGMKRERVGRS